MTIEERLEALEISLSHSKRINRLLLSIVIMILMFLAVAITAGIGNKEKIIEANKFNLLDANGNEAACLWSLKDGPVLFLSDKKGRSRARLSVFENGPSLEFFDENGSECEINCVNGHRINK